MNATAQVLAATLGGTLLVAAAVVHGVAGAGEGESSPVSQVQVPPPPQAEAAPQPEAPPPQPEAPPAAALPVAAPTPAPPAAEDLPAPGAVVHLDEVVITATRSPRPLRDVPAAVTVLPRAEIERSPTKTADELLRIVPSFGLFRRSSSVVADPSSQGVNLRGIGPSGVSRSLVLLDGVPANDAFGGWVYWRSIPRIGIQRIEVVPGGGSALYGNYALGGVTQVFSRPITAATADAGVEVGSFDTSLLDARAANLWGPVGAAVETELFKSGGYPVVASYQRGPIDTAAPGEHATVSGRVEAAAASDLALAARAGYFYEGQNGGTRHTTSAVRQLGYSGSARYTPGEAGVFDVSVFGHAGDFVQQRARINAARTTEDLSASQVVPGHDVGLGLLWTSRALLLGGKHTLTVGSDLRWILGDTFEDLFAAAPAPNTVVRRDAGGKQRLQGVFAQDVYDVSEALALSFAVRYDRWDNADASVFERHFDGSTVFTPFPARSDSMWSPKLGLRLRALDWLTVRAAAYRAFRAPTLNELYRTFQVGQVVTLANPDLAAERLAGAEAGLEVATRSGFTARVTGFWNELEDPVTNVTLDPANPNLRQRQNLGRARIRGIEAEVGWRPARAWLATAAYTFVDNRVTDAPGQPQLLGNDLLQDPRHRASVSLAFDDPRLVTAVAQVRYVGPQYEDDRNTLWMTGAAVVDLSASRALGANVDAVLAVENLLDKKYLVGRAGVDTVGQPRFIHGGLRVHMD